MKRSVFRLACGLGLAVFLVGAAAAAPTTYSYTTQPYTITQDYVGPCPAGQTCANFTVGQQATFSFTLPNPLPANQPQTDITSQVTSWNANDGLTTYSRADARSHLLQVSVATDSAGDIVASSALVGGTRWMTPGVHANGDRVAAVVLTNSGDQAVFNASCTNVGPGDSCFNLNLDNGSSGAATPTRSTWVAAPEIVPTLTEWAMIGLALVLGGFGALSLARRRTA